MTVRISPLKRGGWEYDIYIHWPEGGRDRERAKAPVPSKTAALRWAQAREAAYLAAGKAAFQSRRQNPDASPHPPVAPATITLAAFWPRVVKDHYEANRKKPSTVDGAKSIFRLHLGPNLGTKPLDQITDSDIAALKGVLAAHKPKTVNNILTVLSKTLTLAVKWKVIPARPCTIEFLPVDNKTFKWYERHDYRRLVEAAGKMSTAHLVLVLLAGSAGLRRGEVIALKWTDLDLARKMINVQRSFWRQHETVPKGGRGRMVPMTDELAAALKAHKHLRGERVLYSEKGEQLSNRCIRNWMRSTLKRAGLPVDEGDWILTKGGHKRRERDVGGIHALRHTFCSHLAAAGVPAKAIQELAGHADLATTMRYMHLAPSDRLGAMGMLGAYYKAPEVGAKEKTG